MNILNKLKQNILLIITILLVVPSFFKMFDYGMFSTQDFHLFRLQQFDKCVQRLEIPCRWADDAGLGYGEPVFNFYGQLSYAFAEVFHLVGFSFVDSLKITFALSFLLSAVAMYFLALNLWQSVYGAVITSLLYVYAPYRALDVWVRGALPESMSFIFYPLIILAVEKKNLLLFSSLIFLLIINHNLSFVMFLPLLLVWLVYRKWWKGFLGFAISFLLSAFYVLPVLFESKYIDLGSTISGYYDFRAHFITLKQIFLDFSWGYGGSTWGDGDGINMSLGLLHWLLPFLISVIIGLLFYLKKKKLDKYTLNFTLLIVLAIFYLLLTHNKSAFVWELLNFMEYIQFPWRFIGIAVFLLSLSVGYFFKLFDKKWIFALFLVAIAANHLVFGVNYFKPDLWFEVGDSYYFEGPEWDRQREASLRDYWPNLGHNLPDSPSDGKYINYFPGWEGQFVSDGLMLKEGSKFSDTPIRKVANTISLISIIGLVILAYKRYI